MTKFILLTLLFLPILICTSQEEVRFENLRSLRSGESFIRFQVMDLHDSKKVNLNNDKTYYWFKSQKVMSTQGGASGLLLDGVYEEFYPNSQLKLKGAFKKGLKHGEWMHWSNDGHLRKEVKWRRGKRIKKAFTYDENGNVIKQENHSSHKVVYRYQNKTIKTNSDSTEVEVIHKYDGGQIKQIERYENNQLEGKQVGYDKEGNLDYLKKYKEGQLHGKQIDKEGNKTFYRHGEKYTPFLRKLFGNRDEKESEEAADKDQESKDQEQEEDQYRKKEDHDE